MSLAGIACPASGHLLSAQGPPRSRLWSFPSQDCRGRANSRLTRAAVVNPCRAEKQGTAVGNRLRATVSRQASPNILPIAVDDTLHVMGPFVHGDRVDLLARCARRNPDAVPRILSPSPGAGVLDDPLGWSVGGGSAQVDDPVTFLLVWRDRVPRVGLVRDGWTPSNSTGLVSIWSHHRIVVADGVARRSSPALIRRSALYAISPR